MDRVSMNSVVTSGQNVMVGVDEYAANASSYARRPLRNEFSHAEKILIDVKS